MRKILKSAIYLALSIPFSVFAQSESTGIKFIENLSWEEIKAKAIAENKYIFVDGYATWCAPCKAMDKEVYPIDSVGSVINTNFISVKVQMDSTKKDNERTKEWYADAHKLMTQGVVSSFPTYLFFAPDGSLVHKGVGYRDPESFVSLAEDALDTGKQYFRLIHNYENGIKDYKIMPYLAMTAREFNDTAVANTIGEDYINNYLVNLKSDELFTLENIQFIALFTRGTQEKGFQILFTNEEKINKTVKRADYAQNLIHYFISRDFIDPVLLKAAGSPNKNIDWMKLKSNIQKKYNNYYAERTITGAKARWYADIKDWSNFSTYTVEFVENYGSNMGDFDLAVHSWSVFERSTNKDELKKAMNWAKKVMDRSVDSSNVLPSVMDTYANLLHKVGYLFENNKSNHTAIEIEEHALVLANKYKVENFITTFKTAIEKMKKGEPTW